MALKRAEALPGEFVETADYPEGAAFDATHSIEGTAYLAEWQNDEFGFYDALIQAAGIQRSGVPDTVNNSDYFDAFLNVLNGQVSPLWNDEKGYVHPAMVFGSDNILYISKRDNIAKNPTTSPRDWTAIVAAESNSVPNTKWLSTTSYNHPTLVFGSDSLIYKSLKNSLGKDPIASPEYWTDLKTTLSSAVMPYNDKINYQPPAMYFQRDFIRVKTRDEEPAHKLRPPLSWRSGKAYSHPAAAIKKNDVYLTKQSNVDQQPPSSPEYWTGLSETLGKRSTAWDKTKKYFHPDLVLANDDNLYITKRTNTGQPPESSPDDWTLFSRLIADAGYPEFISDSQKITPTPGSSTRSSAFTRDQKAFLDPTWPVLPDNNWPFTYKKDNRMSWMSADEGFCNLTHSPKTTASISTRLRADRASNSYILESGEYILQCEIPLIGGRSRYGGGYKTRHSYGVQFNSFDNDWDYAYSVVVWGKTFDNFVRGSYVGQTLLTPPHAYLPPTISQSYLLAKIKTTKQVPMRIGVIWSEEEPTNTFYLYNPLGLGTFAEFPALTTPTFSFNLYVLK